MATINIAVCIRQIVDPEIPARAFRIDPEAKRAIPPKDMELVISDYDETAVEAALQIKNSQAANITVISLGAESARTAIRRCIAMGADGGVLLSDPVFDDSDSFATASIIASAIKKMDGFDLILCGRQEGDWDAGQVGSGIAELLGLPSMTMIGKIQLQDRKAVVERVVSDGREIAECPLPALLTVSSEIGEPRYPSLRRIREAFKVEIPIWNASDVPAAKAKNRLLSLSIPVREAKCEFVEAEEPEEAGAKLALKLREARLI